MLLSEPRCEQVSIERFRGRVLMLSFDVEDWFQVERLRSAITRYNWDNYELRLVENMEKLLSILRKHNTRATFFILGWIAERLSNLVSRIRSDGHEIARSSLINALSCYNDKYGKTRRINR